MREDELGSYLLIILAAVAVIGLGLSAASLATHESMGGMMGFGGGGMMQGNGGSSPATTQPGLFEWAILILSAAFFIAALALLFRGRSAGVSAAPTRPDVPISIAQTPAPEEGRSTPSRSLDEPGAAPPMPVAEPTLIKLLDEDEKRMYLELRDHGGQMFQRDLVALGIFSKAKVTRVLDKLEAKGLVVREAHGMTNRVRLVSLPER